jgi:dTDP-glucose 4,6-dehydratase
MLNKRLRPLKYLITGGAGFIGLAFTKLLVRNYPESEIVIFDKLTYASQQGEMLKLLKNSQVEFIKGDISDFKLSSTMMDGVDLVVNFAAESHVDRSINNSIPFVKSNTLGVQVLLECALQAKVKIFIQVSTDEVYGSINSGSWNEFSPLEPNSPYAASKASGDLLAIAFHRTHGLDIRITRCSNNYGPGQHYEKLIPKSIKSLINSKPIQIYGDGQNKREWIHVDDHCRAIMKVIEKGSAGEIYNIGSNIERSNNEIISELIEIAKPNFTGKIVYVEDRKGHDQRYSLNFAKISNLGFSPEIPLESGLKQTFEWYKNRSVDS